MPGNRRDEWRTVRSVLSVRRPVSHAAAAVTRRSATLAAVLGLLLGGTSAALLPAPEADALTVTVVHGRDGREGEFGSLVILADKSLWQRDGTLDAAHFCGGTLVTPSIVVTAAHCMAGESPSSMVVGVVANGDRRDPDPTVRSVARIIIHPDYSRQTMDNDIAVVHLSAPLRGSATTRPARPSDSRLFAAGAAVRSAGWGRLSTAGAEPRIVQVAEMVAFPETSCGGGNEAFTVGALTFAPWGSDDVRPEYMLCAAGVRSLDSKVIDTCVGDSGGPLLGGSGTSTRLVGIVSWGPTSCAEMDGGAAGRPGVYTRVAAYTDFLRDEGVPFLDPPARPVIASALVVDRRVVFVVRNVVQSGVRPERALVRCGADGRTNESGTINDRRRAVVEGLARGVRYECRALIVTAAGRAISVAYPIRLPRR